MRCDESQKLLNFGYICPWPQELFLNIFSDKKVAYNLKLLVRFCCSCILVHSTSVYDSLLIDRECKRAGFCSRTTQFIRPPDVVEESLVSAAILSILLPRCTVCNAVLAIVQPSVRPSDRLSNAWILTKRIKLSPMFLYRSLCENCLRRLVQSRPVVFHL